MNTKEARAYIRKMMVDPEILPSGSERQRCRKCRKYFSGYTFLGRFCSTECAGITDLWREATQLVNETEQNRCPHCRGGSGRKRIYAIFVEAERDAAELASKTGLPYKSYRCLAQHLYSGERWHVGHRR